MAATLDMPITEVAETKSAPAPRTKTIFRTTQAPCWLNPADSVGRALRELLDELGHLTRRANAEAIRLVMAALEVESDDQKHLLRADLVIPCPSLADEAAAEKLLLESRRTTDEPSDYLNSYRLVKREARGSERSLLRFRIAAGEKKLLSGGRTGWRVSVIRAVFLQMIVIRWLRPRLLWQLPGPVRQGLGQEVAQQLLSHLGLQERDVERVSAPALDERDCGEVVEDRRKNLAAVVSWVEPESLPKSAARAFLGDREPRCQTIRFIASDNILIYRRRREERRRVGIGREAKAFSVVTVNRFYAALPVFAGLSADSPLNRFADRPELFWWHNHLGEFEPLKPWQTVSKTRKIDGEKQKVVAPRHLLANDQLVFVPLGIGCGKKGRDHRLLNWLSNRDYQICWSLLSCKEQRIGRQPAPWMLQFVFRRQVSLVFNRPNLLGLSFSREPIFANGKAVGWGSVIRFALVAPDGAIIKEGSLLTDRIPMAPARRHHRWRDERRRIAYEAARMVVKLAVVNDANLALQNISFVKKRTVDSQANVVATRWNYADLARAIADKGEELPEPVTVVWRVNDYLLREIVDPAERARAVALEAWRQLQNRRAR